MLNIPKTNLRIPGPTPCPPDVLAATSQQMINHRGPEFKALIESVTLKLKRIFMTENTPYTLTASGTGALETAIVNTLSPGDKVLAVSIGYFGDRFADIATTYGADVTKLNFEWGTHAEPEVIRQRLKADQGIKAVLITHNETSTGITNPLEEIASIAKSEFNKLLLVDAISSLGCIPLPTDDWQCDVVCTASQKGLMVPPGLCFVSMSETAWEAYSRSSMPKIYFDLERAKNTLEKGQTPWTPAVSILYGLDLALSKLLDEGMEQVFIRHVKIADLVRSGIKRLGLELLADQRYASNTVTSVRVPDGVDVGKLSGLLRTEHSVIIAGGQGPLNKKIFRIGHLGFVDKYEIEGALDAIRLTLPKVGFEPLNE